MQHIWQHDTSRAPGFSVLENAGMPKAPRKNPIRGEALRKWLGARIRAARKAADLKQGELSLKCGWDGNNGRISNYENGTNEPNLADLRRIAEACNKDLSFFMPDAGDSGDEEMGVYTLQRLSAEEAAMLASYRALDDDKRELAGKLIEGLAPNMIVPGKSTSQPKGTGSSTKQ